MHYFISKINPNLTNSNIIKYSHGLNKTEQRIDSRNQNTK